MIQKLEKLDRVIDKIVRDLGLTDVPFADFIEWFADALLHIGAYPQFEEKTGTIRIENYEGILPDDLYKLITLNDSTEVKEGSGGFYGGTFIKALEENCISLDELSPYERYKYLIPGMSKIENNLNYSQLTNQLSHSMDLSPAGREYRINHNKITTGFEYGFIEIEYLAFPTDERGWPLVPDDVSFRDALFWKAAYHISMRNPKSLANPRMQDMEYCRQMWNKYCTQARASANRPDLAQMERIKNNWLRLHNNRNEDITKYNSLGRAQNINLHGHK